MILSRDSSSLQLISNKIVCQAGTYSINPLAGYTDTAASCIPCPADASCAGGAAVVFKKGVWSAQGGLFRLVGCPPGNALVNSIDGEFSLDVQR